MFKKLEILAGIITMVNPARYPSNGGIVLPMMIQKW